MASPVDGDFLLGFHHRAQFFRFYCLSSAVHQVVLFSSIFGVTNCLICIYCSVMSSFCELTVYIWFMSSFRETEFQTDTEIVNHECCFPTLTGLGQAETSPTRPCQICRIYPRMMEWDGLPHTVFFTESLNSTQTLFTFWDYWIR
ncbi:hypothetical protein ILYODFUR_023124 [Ilyodon furcidens]|uniref:Uncharacterized protein n=1 Tax=Ilyodon furcidens TaxID=33524 RepID=A0ABV0VJC4_9TELE